MKELNEELKKELEGYAEWMKWLLTDSTKRGLFFNNGKGLHATLFTENIYFIIAKYRIKNETIEEAVNYFYELLAKNGIVNVDGFYKLAED